MKYVLTLGKGKRKRQWELSPEEFDEFSLRYEENELIEYAPENIKDVRITLVDPPGSI